MICAYITNHGLLCPAIIKGTHILFMHETGKWTYFVDAHAGCVLRAKPSHLKNLKYTPVQACKKDAADLNKALALQERDASRYEQMVLVLASDKRAEK